MARRTERFETDEIQGEGSYVVMRTMSRGERKHLERVRDQNRDTWEEDGRDIFNKECDTTIVACLVDWNWTGADGEALPLPRVPEDMDALSDEESEFLFDAMYRASFLSEQEKKG